MHTFPDAMRSVVLGFVVLGLTIHATTAEESVAAESLLLETETEELGEVVRYSFRGADGKWLRRTRLPGASRQRASQVSSGYRELYVRVERLGPYLDKDSKRRNVWWARATVGASLQPGRTYQIQGRFVPSEDVGVYCIMDVETGDPVSEPFELVFVTGVPRREPWYPPTKRKL